MILVLVVAGKNSKTAMEQTNNIIEKIRENLLAVADEKTAESTKRFFKNEIFCLGVKSPDVKKITKDIHNSFLKNQKKEFVFDIAEKIMQNKSLEEFSMASEFIFSCKNQYTKEDMSFFEKIIDNYVSNWASCDVFCNHTVGAFVELFPEYVDSLKEWTKSDNLWKRRASAVSLIIPARKALFLDDILYIAENLLIDKEDMVQKGYGWLLKAASLTETFVHIDETTKTTHHDAVFNFILKYKGKMPRTSLRYAIEKFNPEEKKICMAK